MLQNFSKTMLRTHVCLTFWVLVLDCTASLGRTVRRKKFLSFQLPSVHKKNPDPKMLIGLSTILVQFVCLV